MPSVAVAALAAFTLSPQSPYSETWQSVSQAIRTRYYARDSRKAEMERLLGAYATKASGAKDREAFAEVMDTMIREFKDSHFDFFTPADQGFYLMDGLLKPKDPKPMANMGAWFRRAADGYTVTMVLEGLPAAAAGLQKGDVIQSINGAAFSPVASLEGKVGKAVNLTYLRAGKTQQAEVRVREDSALGMFLAASRNSSRIIEHKGKKIGYFHLWTQANDDFRNALSGAVYGPLKDTQAMILDLRDGFGGRPEGFADPFFRPEVNLEWKFGETASMKQLFGYQRPLVVLINQGSRSAKEVLSYILKKAKRATLVGTTTAGHVLGTSPLRLNDWAYLEIPMVDVITDNVRLEGKGVAPDVVVPVEFGPDGTDLVTAKALEILSR